MKARIRKELVLLYHLEESTEKGRKIAGVIAGMGIPYRHIPEELAGESVGFCAGAPGFPKSESRYDGTPPAGEAMIFQNLTGSRLNRILSGLSAADPDFTIFKAVVTDTNIGWPLYRLLGELASERRAIGQSGKE